MCYEHMWHVCHKYDSMESMYQDGRIEPMGLTHQRHTLAFRQVGSDEVSISTLSLPMGGGHLSQSCRLFTPFEALSFTEVPSAPSHPPLSEVMQLISLGQTSAGPALNSKLHTASSVIEDEQLIV